MYHIDCRMWEKKCIVKTKMEQNFPFIETKHDGNTSYKAQNTKHKYIFRT
jgi:hypothetical protein